MKRSFVILLLVFCLPLYGQFNIDTLIQQVNSVTGTEAKQALTDAFVDSAQSGGIPIIQGNQVIFIYRGNPGYVSLGGDHNNWQATFKRPLKHIDSTNFHYKIENFESHARFEDAFLIDDIWVRDFENTKTGTRYSELAMPDYVYPWETAYIDSVNRGEIVSTKLNYLADNIDKEYNVSVYLPYDYNPQSHIKYPTVYFQDGSLYLRYARVKYIFDNLIHFKVIDPLIVVFVDPHNRAEEYLLSQKASYAEFFATHLVNYIDSLYTTDTRASKRLVLGPSYGGNISAYISYVYANVFANCGLHSAAWRPTFDVYYLITEGEKKDISYYAVWGTYEYPIADDMRKFRNDVLNLGYNFAWGEFPEGHNFGFWKARIDDIVAHFFPYTGTVNSIERASLPEIFVLKQNYPNPFNPKTVISYELRIKNYVKLVVYDALGKVVKTLVDKEQASGKYQVMFDAHGLASGIYYYQLIAEPADVTQGLSKGAVLTRKMVLIK